MRRQKSTKVLVKAHAEVQQNLRVRGRSQPDDVDEEAEQVAGGEGGGGLGGRGAGCGRHAVGAQQIHALRLCKGVQPSDCQRLAISAH